MYAAATTGTIRRMIGTTTANDVQSTGRTAVDAEAKKAARAVRILRDGGLVALPTETVYGLGADATNAQAVRKIFTAKGRPQTNPLIVHVADASVARRFSTAWPPAAERLAMALWPGPLTLVLPKASMIVDEVTAGQSTVALRAPDHPLALKVLLEFGGPVAAPSANRSSRVSPTTAEHVRRDLGRRVDLILDGGPCRVGIESTVLDLTRRPPMILRPGAVSREAIEELIGPVEIFSGSAAGIASSPGQQTVHYAPTAAAYRFAPAEAPMVLEFARHHPSIKVVVLALADSSSRTALAKMPGRLDIREMPSAPDRYARQFYAALREADERADAIWIEEPPQTPPWLAIRDRINRATQNRPRMPA
jgi:L-threonylcarbamoyladenylate synthase